MTTQKEWFKNQKPVGEMFSNLKVTDKLTYHMFSSTVGMCGRLLAYKTDGTDIFEAEYFSLDIKGLPYVDGKNSELKPCGLTVCWHSGWASIEWERSTEQEVIEMTFNRFKLIVDLLHIDDYNASDGYRKITGLDGRLEEEDYDQDDLVTTINYIGKNPKYNFFKLPTFQI